MHCGHPSLVALRVPQLEDDDEGDDEELQHHSQDAQRHVLDGDHLRRLVLEEERPAALGDSEGSRKTVTGSNMPFSTIHRRDISSVYDLMRSS